MPSSTLSALPETADLVESDVGVQPGDATTGDPVVWQIEAMTAAWQRGVRARAEQFFTPHPDYPAEDALRLICAEACLRADYGETAIASDLLRRFPQWRAQLEALFSNSWQNRAPLRADLPAVGDELGDFRLQTELGRGALGRTFLAVQRSLADRPVVLKITPLGHNEHLSLARLQHMHIVPLYFEQVLPDRRVRVLGMPYLGGATLAHVLDELGLVPVAERTGRRFLDALDRHCASPPADASTVSPFRKYLAQASYVQAVCWLGACLADALQYAHERDLIHLDVKPSNVLITSDAQPMLLDFHLARAPLRPGMHKTGRVGGTNDYLSPEQRLAIAALRRGQDVTVAVDGRTDVYSLGLLLDKALSGAATTDGTPGRQPLERRNRCVSRGLSDIVARCLAPEPVARYRDAAALALDLRLHLGDLPLRGVPNRSLIERWRKWRRREPAALDRAWVRLAATGVVLGAFFALAVHSRQQTQQVQAALDEGRRHLAGRQYPAAVQALRRGLALAPGRPDSDLTRALDAALRQTLRAQVAQDLHALVDALRFRFGVTPPPDDEARLIEARARAIWDRRSLLTPDDRQTADQTRLDFLDLATVLADCRARAGSDDALRAAAHLLEAAREQFGPSPALLRDLGTYSRRLGLDPADGGDVPSPRTAWEHYDLGRSYLRSSNYTLAEDQFRRAVALQPGEFWPHFFQGVCAYRLGRFPEAAAQLDTCVALAPRTAACYYNRAKVHEALGQVERALADHSRALELDPTLADAALNRGILWYRQGRYDQAAADFERARGATTSPKTLGLVHYNVALVHLARSNQPAAAASLRQAIEYGDAAAFDLYRRLGKEGAGAD